MGEPPKRCALRKAWRVTPRSPPHSEILWIATIKRRELINVQPERRQCSCLIQCLLPISDIKLVVLPRGERHQKSNPRQSNHSSRNGPLRNTNRPSCHP